jgi:A/G-specific adenine glycosylase
LAPWSTAELRAIRSALLSWFERRARDLPWRRTRDPYQVWLSEVMLQQTRVETVTPYYQRFLAAFSDVAALARAPLEDVLRCWSGLGYYTRARNLHAAARIIVRERGGEFPGQADAWLELPGVGRYTAAAIASIVSGEAVAVLDGNVKRVLSRLTCFTRPIDSPGAARRLWGMAGALLERRAPGAFNQAMMELGATVCVPRRPRCNECPIREHCRAALRGVQARLPLRRPKSPAPQIEAVAAVLERNGRVLMVRRPPSGLLGGLWELPGGEMRDGEALDAALCRVLHERFGLAVEVDGWIGAVRHAFTHRRLTVHVHRCRRIHGRVHPAAHDAFRWVQHSEMDRLALSSLDRRMLALLRDGPERRGRTARPRRSRTRRPGVTARPARTSGRRASGAPAANCGPQACSETR